MIYTIDQIRQIASPIAAAYGVKSMRLFGSYARDEATEQSDVDILVDRGSIRSGFVLGGLYKNLRDGFQKETGHAYCADGEWGISGEYLAGQGDDLWAVTEVTMLQSLGAFSD